VLLVGVVIVTGLNFGSGTSGVDRSNAGSSQQPERDQTPLARGVAAPDFSLPSPDGNTYSLSQYKGKVVVLEFLAPWCPHCQEHAPMLTRVYEAYKDKGVQFLGVSASPYGHNYSKTDQTPISMDDMVWFRDTFGVTFPLLLDKDVKSAENYHILYFPTLYVVDKNGSIATEIVADVDKPITYEWIASEIDNALK
jgi:peroxiredoxin